MTGDTSEGEEDEDVGSTGGDSEAEESVFAS